MVVVTDGAQPDGMPMGEVGTIAEHRFGFSDEGNQVTMNFFLSGTKKFINLKKENKQKRITWDKKSTKKMQCIMIFQYYSFTCSSVLILDSNLSLSPYIYIYMCVCVCVCVCVCACV